MQLLSLNLLEDKLKPSVVLQLAGLVYDYFKERHDDILTGDLSVCKTMIETMLDNNVYIYYVEESNTILGFTIMTINNQYGMVQPHLVIDYMYTAPVARGSFATALLFCAGAYVGQTLNMDLLGTTFVTSSNINNAKVVGGVELATTFLYRREDFKDKYKKYIKRYVNELKN